MALASLYRHFELMSERRERVLPTDWTRPGGRPDPDFVLRNRIVQTINHSLAISRLFEDGLNNSARALARVNHEACLQTIVLCADRDVMIEHCSAHTPEDAVQVWYRHFTKKKLARQIDGIGGAIRQQLGGKRKRKGDRDGSDPVFEWFSDSVHSSFMASNVGAYATDADTGKIVSVLYGEADADAESALFAVNGSLIHSTALLFAVLVLRHDLIVEPTSRPLVSFKATQTAVRKVLLERGLGRRTMRTDPDRLSSRMVRLAPKSK
jgi:hypothetical protein